MLDRYHDFFTASASVAGALIGLLFVAISVARERHEDVVTRTLHEIRALAALTSFSNALAVSLFALIPDGGLRYTELVVSILGLLFVTRSLLVLLRVSRGTAHRHPRDGLFIILMGAWFVGQLIVGIGLTTDPASTGLLDWAAIFVIVFFLTGIARAWELIGGPQYRLAQETAKLIRSGAGRDDGPPEDDPSADQPS